MHICESRCACRCDWSKGEGILVEDHDLLGREAGTWESQTFRHVDMLGKAVSQPATYGMAGQGRYAFQGRQAG